MGRRRRHPGEEITPCWSEPQAVDVFGADGRYLGRVALPDTVQLSARSWISDRTVVAAVEDEAGTIMVERYRLVLPGEGS